MECFLDLLISLNHFSDANDISIINVKKVEFLMAEVLS